jgi:hypothetical protein
MKRDFDWKKYILVFAITVAIFGTTLYASNYFNARRMEEVRSIEERISTDILSLETQFDLLEELSCEDLKQNPVLTRELAELADRLNYTEQRLGTDNAEVIRLKKIYSLLLIKDSILMKRISQECKTEPISIFYFYSNKGNCDDCTRQGYVLTDLQREYPQLRVYAFDYNLDLSALRTMRSIYNVEERLPALVIKDKVYYGLKNKEDIARIVPAILFLNDATSTATTSTTSTRRK